MRRIILDTEATGKQPQGANRMIEIGMIETIDWQATGRSFHAWINPGQPSLPGSFRIHGLSEDYLKGFPEFSAVAEGIIAFIGEDLIVAHDAAGDASLLNEELQRAGRDVIDRGRFQDSLRPIQKARKEGPHGLHALAQALGIEAGHGRFHGALQDAQMLLGVIQELQRSNPDLMARKAQPPRPGATLERERMIRAGRTSLKSTPEAVAFTAEVARTAAGAQGAEAVMERLLEIGCQVEKVFGEEGGLTDLAISRGGHSVCLRQIKLQHVLKENTTAQPTTAQPEFEP